MATKILFLDDSEERHDAAKKWHDVYWEDVTWCWTAKEAIDALKNKEFDIVFLDHDLGGEHFVNSEREDCGMEVVRWIMQNEPVIELIVVHSWNIPAAKRMTENLLDSGYSVSVSPFTPYTMITKNEAPRERVAELETEVAITKSDIDDLTTENESLRERVDKMEKLLIEACDPGDINQPIEIANNEN